MADHNREYAPVPRNSGRALKIPSVPGLTAWCDPQCHPETAPEGFIGPRTAFFGTSDVPLVVLDGFGRGHRHINMGHEIHIEGEGTDLDRERIIESWGKIGCHRNDVTLLENMTAHQVQF